MLKVFVLLIFIASSNSLLAAETKKKASLSHPPSAIQPLSKKKLKKLVKKVLSQKKRKKRSIASDPSLVEVSAEDAVWFDKVRAIQDPMKFQGAEKDFTIAADGRFSCGAAGTCYSLEGLADDMMSKYESLPPSSKYLALHLSFFTNWKSIIPRLRKFVDTRYDIEKGLDSRRPRLKNAFLHSSVLSSIRNVAQISKAMGGDISDA
ncbi:MAG: hypothetical protein AAF202_09965, partial [Pseudomonadota bacterium]